MSQTAIRPEIVAGKLAAAHALSQPGIADELAKEPRLVELLWYLQWHSLQPGGLAKFAADLIAEFPGRVGPSLLTNAPPGPLSPALSLEIWQRFPRPCREEIGRTEFWRLETLDKETEPRDAAAIASLGHQAFIDSATGAARQHLEFFLESLCNEVSRSFHGGPPWYFPEILSTLFAAMDSHAQRARENIAMTEVALKCFDALDYAWQEKTLAQITGDSRFGKTEAVKAWCLAFPGRARLVATPFSNCDADLYRAVADALGIVHDCRTPQRQLRETVEFTVRHSGLLFVFDEAHFLLPTRFSKNTVPMRLNWLRTVMVDRNVPVVLISTPQDYQHAASKFERETKYNFAQWVGRIGHKVILPEKLETGDLLAIAEKHCPDMPKAFHRQIVGHAMLHGLDLQVIQAIGKRARYIARRDGHPAITLDDLTVAIREAIPASAPAPAPAVAPDPAPPRPPARARSAPAAAANRLAAAPAASGPPPSRSSRPAAPALETVRRDKIETLIPS